MQVPPHSREHEYALVSCCMHEPMYCGREALDTFGDECPFYTPECALVWSAFQRVDLDKIAVLTVSDFLGDRLDLTKIREIANTEASIAHFKTHLDWVRKHHVQRGIIRRLERSLAELYDPKAKPDEIVEDIRSDVGYVICEGNKSSTMSECVDEFKESLANDELGTSCGYDKLDNVVAPIPWESMVVLAARAKIGKSALSMGMCINLAIQGHKPVYYSLEMPKKQLVARAIASAACISSRVKDIKLEADSERFHKACEALSRLDMCIEDTLFDWNKIKRDMKTKAAQGYTHFFLDHVGLVRISLGSNSSREREVATITGECKQLAMQMHRPVFVLCQLNRLAEGVMPKLSHLRESGAVEQDADVVILLHRDRVEGDHGKFLHIRSGGHVDVTAMVAANRHGEEGPVQMRFFPKFSLFSND